MGRDPTQITKPPLDRLVPEFLDRVVKALDICNAVSNGVESVRHFQKLAEIAVSALEQRPIGDGQVRRAKKALSSLVTAMAIEDKEGQTNKMTERTWSFGRRTGVSGSNKDRAAGHFRVLSWGMSKGWSAAKQIQAMSTNMVAPRGNETSSLVQPVYIMSTISDCCDVDISDCCALPGEDGADDAFSAAEELGVGAVVDWLARQDSRGVEEEGEEMRGGANGGDAEDGETRAVIDRVCG